MDPKYSGEMLKHLEKQNDLLMEAYRSMSHELHKLQVEEEMLMRKFYDIMESQSLKKKSTMHIMDETIKKFQCWKFSVFGESKDVCFEEDVRRHELKTGTMTKIRQMNREMETQHCTREITFGGSRVLEFPRSFGAS